MHTTTEEAHRFLRNVNPSQHLKLHLGSDIRNLKELEEMLDIMTETTFRHHVTSNRNDFADWVRSAVKDKELATSIDHMKTRPAITAAVRKRVAELEAVLEQEKVPVFDVLRHGAKDFAAGALIGFLIGVIVAYWI